MHIQNMLKRTVLCTLATSSLLFGDYYSASDARVQGTKTLQYEDGVKVILKKNHIEIESQYNLNYLMDGHSAKEYAPTVFTTKEKVKNPDPTKDGMIVVEKKISYPTYNFNYILKNDIFDKEFALKTSSGLKIVKVTQDDTTIDTPLYPEQKVNVYSYKIVKAFDKKGKKVKIKEDDIVTKYIDQNGDLVAIELLDDGVKDILKVDNAQLQKFLKEKASRVVTVKKFDFSRDKTYLSYVSSSASSSKRLNITYEMKKKNIKTVLESPISLFDPESKSSQIEQNVGILRNYKNRELYELKKVQLIDGESDVVWVNYPNKRVVVVEYVNDGAKDKSLLSKTRKQQFYSMEGLFYLAAWMDANGVQSKIFTYMNGSLPFDATMRERQPHKFEMQKSGKTIFSFTINKKGFVQEMRYPSYNITLHLESVENDTTLRNKKYLKDFQQQNSIKLIKE